MELYALLTIREVLVDGTGAKVYCWYGTEEIEVCELATYWKNSSRFELCHRQREEQIHGFITASNVPTHISVKPDIVFFVNCITSKSNLMFQLEYAAIYNRLGSEHFHVKMNNILIKMRSPCKFVSTGYVDMPEFYVDNLHGVSQKPEITDFESLTSKDFHVHSSSSFNNHLSSCHSK